LLQEAYFWFISRYISWSEKIYPDLTFLYINVEVNHDSFLLHRYRHRHANDPCGWSDAFLSFCCARKRERIRERIMFDDSTESRCSIPSLRHCHSHGRRVKESTISDQFSRYISFVWAFGNRRFASSLIRYESSKRDHHASGRHCR